MPELMKLEIVSAESEIFSGDVKIVEASGGGGEVGIMPGHTPLITTLQTGLITVTMPDDSKEVFYMSGGLLEVQPEVVTILADTAQRAADLDEVHAIEAKEAAEAALKAKHSETEYSAAIQELAQAAAQIRAIKALRDRIKH